MGAGLWGARAARRGWAGPCPQGRALDANTGWALLGWSLGRTHTLPLCAGHIPPRQVGRATGWDIQQVFTVAETAEF